MARKKPFTRVKADDTAVLEPSTFETHYVKARGLYTAGPDSQVWQGQLPTLPAKVDLKGFIVRVRPPADVEDSRIEAVKQFLVGQGAAKVFVEPKPQSELMPWKAHGWDEGDPKRPREMVLTLVEQANTQDRDKLRECAEQVMAEKGL